MKSTNIAALLLVGMALVGMTYANAAQRAFAHNFATDESATFIVDIYSAKVHLMLAGLNLHDPDVALEHIEHVRMIIDDDMLTEIAERNERIADDIPAALDELGFMIEGGEDRSAIASQFRNISNLFAEAISVRIDSEHLEDREVQALIVAGFATNALESYSQYHGVEASDHGEHMEEGSMEENSMEEGSMDHSMHASEEDSLRAAKTFTILAKNTFLREKMAADGNSDAMAARNGLVEMRDIVYNKRPVDDATVATHINIHANLQDAFGLELAEGAEEHEEHQEGSMEHMEVVYTFSPTKITIVDSATGDIINEITGFDNADWGDPIATADKSLIFANERNNNEVVVIDTEEQEVIANIPVGPRPTHIYNPHDGDEIWTHSDEEGAFYVIDVNALEVTTIVPAALTGTGHGKLVYSHELGNKAYATNTQDAAVHVIDLEQKEVTAVIETCEGTHGLSYSELSNMVYFACGGPEQVSVVDPSTDTLVKNIAGGGQVWPGAHEPGLSHSVRYIMSPMETEINIIDVTTSEVVGSIEASSVGHIDYHEGHDGTLYGFAPNNDELSVYIFDVDGMELVDTIETGEQDPSAEEAPSHGTSITSSEHYVFVTRQADGNLSIIDAEELTLAETVFIEEGVRKVLYLGAHDVEI